MMENDIKKANRIPNKQQASLGNQLNAGAEGNAEIAIYFYYNYPPKKKMKIENNNKKFVKIVYDFMSFQ